MTLNPRFVQRGLVCLASMVLSAATLAAQGPHFNTAGNILICDQFNNQVLEVNPDTQAFHMVSLNTTLDLDQYWHWHAGRSLRLQFMVENLLNEPIIAPEFEREIINTLPAGAGRTYYGGLTMEY